MQEKLCGVYCIENIINNKKYIGISRDIKRRWSEHRHELNYHIHVNQYLQSAWDKYGKSNFKFYVVELCDESVLSDKERNYIKLYKTLSHENGYNLTVGGEYTSIGKPVISLKDGTIYNFVYEVAEKEKVVPLTMIEWCRQKQNYMYLEEYNLLSKEEKDYWRNFDWDEYNHKKLSKAHSRENLSEITRQKLRNATSGENNPRALKVYCPQLDETFDCIKYASDKYNVNRGSISQCIKGKLKSAGIHPVTGERLTWKKINDVIVC